MAKIHSIETFGTVDGPGIRFVVFMQGCPMRCLYCHNPDTWQVGAGKEMSVEDLVSQIKKYKNYFGNNGGVTVSGGEPLVQIDFVTQLFKRLKQENIHTCIDTSGVLFHTNEQTLAKFDELIKYTNLVLLDIKHIYDKQHKMLTGHSNKNTLEFAKYLDNKGISMWIRYVLVPTINSDEQSLTELKSFINTLKKVDNIEILPYHTLGIKKYTELGIDYKLKNIETPTKEQITLAEKILKEKR